MTRTIEKIKKVLQEPITYTHNFGRLVVGIVGFFFILFGVAVFGASWFEIIIFLIDPTDKLIPLFVTIAEYYLIAITFALVGRSVIEIAQSPTTQAEDVGKLKEHLLAMVVSISGVAFINIIVECETPANLNANILYAGLAIASVVISLGVYIFLTREKGAEEEEREEEGEIGEEGGRLAEVEMDKPPEPEEEK